MCSLPLSRMWWRIWHPPKNVQEQSKIFDKEIRILTIKSKWFATLKKRWQTNYINRLTAPSKQAENLQSYIVLLAKKRKKFKQLSTKHQTKHAEKNPFENMALFLFSHRIEQMSIWPKKTRRPAKLTMQNVVIHTKGIDDCHIMTTDKGLRHYRSYSWMAPLNEAGVNWTWPLSLRSLSSKWRQRQRKSHLKINI